MLEWSILIQFHGALATMSLQFGFKPGVSIDLCTGLIKSDSHGRYFYNGSPVYGRFLDASKAFDRVSPRSFILEATSNRLARPALAVVITLLKWYSD